MGQIMYSLWTLDLLHDNRYIVCQGLREDFDPVRHYMHEINLDLNRLMVSTSTQDVCEIVPMDNLESDQCFFNYIYESNVKWVKESGEYAPHETMMYSALLDFVFVVMYPTNQSLILFFQPW